MCYKVAKFNADLFDGPSPPECKDCTTNEEDRQRHGKRWHGVGRLRPRMVLYNEDNPDAYAIGSCIASDLKTQPGAVIVVGTSLEVFGAKFLVQNMCAAVKEGETGVRIWINTQLPPNSFSDCWDLVVKGRCDEVANLLRGIDPFEDGNRERKRLKLTANASP